MKSALPRTAFLAIGIAAGIFASSNAFAGSKEIAAIQAALDALPPNGDTIATATASNLTIATLNAIDDPANKKLSATVIAGEALKGSGDGNFGTVFGVASFNSTSARIADKNKFAAGAAVSASTGKTANATLVPTFASQFVTDNIGAVALAKLATKSNTAIGAILGGRALDADVTALTRAGVANAGIQDPKLAKAAQQIAQYVGDTVANDTEAANFATAVASASPNKLQQVAVGVTTSNPDAADGIINGLLDAAATTSLVKSKAPKIAKAVGIVADIEQVQLLAVTFGGVVTTKQANSTAKSLIKAISTRNPKTPANGAGELSLVNKADEVGEVAAYFLAAIAKNAGFSTTFGSTKSAANLVFKVVKTMFKSAKIKTIKGTQTSKDLQNQLLILGGNFASSVGFTLRQLNLANVISNDVLAAIQAKLQSGAKAIGGAPNAAALQAQFAAGFNNQVPAGTTGFEDGTAVGSVIDPETDFRNS
jgi:hypothetical protein